MTAKSECARKTRLDEEIRFAIHIVTLYGPRLIANVDLFRPPNNLNLGSILANTRKTPSTSMPNVDSKS